MRLVMVTCVLILFTCSACSTSSGHEDQSSTPDVTPDGVADVERTPEIVGLEVGDTTQEVSVMDDTLLAGVAVSGVFAPLGIPTAGYGQGVDGAPPHSPFTKAFAATLRQHTPIQARALYLQRGEDELLVIRLDKIGTTSEFLDEVTRKLTAGAGRDFEGKLILASNHSHLGPGRLWENMVGEFANDLFWPFYYKRYVADVVATGLAAIADAEPAKIGYAKTECPECHNDRRCENPELKDSTMWVVKVTRLDESLKAVLVNFPIHGTVFGWADYVLSGDAPGMIEQKLEENFSSPVAVLMLQSWGGDVSPGNPEVAAQEPHNATISPQYDRLDRIGYAAAQHILGTLGTISTSTDIDFASVTARPPISYDLVGYEPGEWDYPNGGMMCGTSAESVCWGEEGPAPNMACIPMPPGMAPDKFVISAFHIGGLLFMTIPGEPHTDYSLEVAKAAGTAAGFDDVAIVGYSQDHWGYVMKEYDWLLGGYEPTVSFWGPRQGDYMAAQMPHVAARLVDSAYVYPFEEQAPFDAVPAGGDKSTYSVMDSTGPAASIEDPGDVLGPTDEARFSFLGGDPWLGTPRVVLQREEGGTWQSVLRMNTRLLDNSSYLMETSLAISPSWNDDKETTTRTFTWTVRLPVRRNIPTPDNPGPGSYRFLATGSMQIEDSVVDYEVASAAFAIDLP
jgi:hypothetical protein